MHRALPFVAALGLLAGCGTPMLIRRFDVILRTPEGSAQAAELSYRYPRSAIPSGSDAGIGDFLLGILMEPFDILVSTGVAIDAVGSEEVDVVAGPLGWLAALTPFATLVPDVDFGPRRDFETTEEVLGGLRNDDAGIRRAALRAGGFDAAIVDVHILEAGAR